jgi:glycosyltransferase involved in cell wall biosynthesis
MSGPAPLRALLDAYWWVSGAASGRNVVQSVIGTWNAAYPDDQLTLAVRAHERAQVAAELHEAGITAELISYPRWARVQALAVRLLGRRAGGYDVVLTQNFATRSPRALSCVLVHDAMYVEHPEWFSIPERVYLSALRPTLRSADLVFTTSEAETARIARLWPETRSRLRAVGLGVPSGLTRSVARRPPAVEGDRPFILVVGRLNIRKNLARLMAAFLSDPELADHYRLMVVGQPDGKRDSSAMSSADDRITFLQNIDDGALRWLYENCALFVFPSLDEGFGLPLVEAHALGARSVASDIPPFRELGAEGYFDPRSTDDIAATMRAALTAQTPAPPRRPDDWEAVVARLRGAVVDAVNARRSREQRPATTTRG